MGRVIAISNQKGGVGKTTTAINLSACLAEKGKRVLTIDMDPQGNTTSGLGIDKSTVEHTSYQLLTNETTIWEAMTPSIVPGLSVIASERSLAGAEIELIGVEDREFILKKEVNNILEIEGVVFTMYDARTCLSLQVVENVKQNLHQNIYKTIIPRNVRLAEAPSHGLPINLYEPKSAGADGYRSLADEVINRGKEEE